MTCDPTKLWSPGDFNTSAHPSDISHFQSNAPHHRCNLVCDCVTEYS